MKHDRPVSFVLHYARVGASNNLTGYFAAVTNVIISRAEGAEWARSAATEAAPSFHFILVAGTVSVAVGNLFTISVLQCRMDTHASSSVPVWHVRSKGKAAARCILVDGGGINCCARC